MAPRSVKNSGRPTPRLYLVTPPLDAPNVAANLAAAVAAGDVAAVLARLPGTGDATLIERLRAIAPVVQDRGIALLIDGRADLVAPTGVDGAHVAGTEALAAALPLLKPRYIAGCGALASRHDAMTAGERGADYVMFGEPGADGRRPSNEAVLDRVAWWAELFEIPCVGWAANLDEVAGLAAAGADFIALGDFVWTAVGGPGRAVAEATLRLGVVEPVS
jgi:thiamine-phosphate pyrophosphorylase